MTQGSADWASFRPEILGSVGALHPDGAYTMCIYFTSEAEARSALARVKAGGDLAAEAKGGGDPGLARSGGDTGSLSRGQPEPALGGAAFRAPLREAFGPTRLKVGGAGGEGGGRGGRGVGGRRGGG